VRPGLENLRELRELRDTRPVSWDPDARAWNVYRYHDAATVLSDHATFSSDFGSLFPERRDLIEGNIVALDPPRHDQLRGLVSLAFTPRAIAQLEGRIAQISEELLDQTSGRTQIELVADFAYPLPVIVIAELLGVPAADRTLFKSWADALLDNEQAVDLRDEATLEIARAEIGNFHEYLRDHVRARHTEPRRDLLSDLVAAEIDGQRLTEDEIVGFATVLLLAGHVTTTTLLGNAILCLDEYPEVQDAMRARPATIPIAIEEVLRYRGPVPRTVRVTTRDVQLADERIPDKQLLNVWLQSANHDERVFEAPDRFVMGRQPNPHFAFGRGIHFCLGAPLARLESRVALDVLLRRFACLRVDPARPVRMQARFGGPRELPLLVEPALSR
jgi:cytochrome P450